MELTPFEQSLLSGEHGRAARKAMEILLALGTIYGAERTVPVASVQVAGVSYDNLGEAGLGWLDEMAAGLGRARVLTTLNPAGMDMENWAALGISADFAANQQRVLDAFSRMGIQPSCTCTPYLTGNLPAYAEHIAWSESSAVCYANSVIGARTNREGGPSALAAAITGVTPAYGYHLDQQRSPDITAAVQAEVHGTHQFGALGKAIGEKLQAAGRRVAYLTGVQAASPEELKALCASLATYGGAALFHIQRLTPEAGLFDPPADGFAVIQAELVTAVEELSDASAAEVDFVSLGCPHLSLDEIARLAELLHGKQVKREFWITTARATKQIADRLGYTEAIEASGAKFAADTCCVVAPIRGRFHTLATDSAKACYYAYAKNVMATVFRSVEEVVDLAVSELPAAPDGIVPR